MYKGYETFLISETDCTSTGTLKGFQASYVDVYRCLTLKIKSITFFLISALFPSFSAKHSACFLIVEYVLTVDILKRYQATIQEFKLQIWAVKPMVKDLLHHLLQDLPNIGTVIHVFSREYGNLI